MGTEDIRLGLAVHPDVRPTTGAAAPPDGSDEKTSEEKPSGAKPPAPSAELRTHIIRRTSKLDGLFAGFRRFRGISYGASPEVVLELIERYGYEQVELVLGENLSQSSREKFGRDRSPLEKLTELIEQGRVRILVPRGNFEIHTKLYFLDNGDDKVRVISTSSNLTKTGIGGKQINHAITADLGPGNPFRKALEEDYEEHLKLCEPFLGDLLDLIKKEGDRARAIEAWLAASAAPAEHVERKIVADLFGRALEEVAKGPTSSVTLELPANTEASKFLRKSLLDPVHAQKLDDRTYSIEAPNLIEQLQKSVAGMPLMKVDAARRRIFLWADGRAHERSVPPQDPLEVSRALDHIERYVGTAKFGATGDPAMAMTALWEALLAVLSTPFAHEEMKLIRRKYRTEVVSRGPALICIHGPSHNGKTTFLKFALKLMCGFPVEPLPGPEFRQARIRAYTAVGNLFPLIFDDILATSASIMEPIVKSYWEQGGWDPEVPHPQLVLTTNREAFKAWAKTRLKRIAFDIEYTRSGEGTKTLSRLFEESNEFFAWFADRYLASLGNDEGDALEDSIARARSVVAGLYAFAGRTVPVEFPRRPLEELFDHDKKRWQELLRLKKASIKGDREGLFIEFDPAFQIYEITEYHQMLPQGIKSRRHANLIKIENPAQFDAWIGRKANAPGFFARMMKGLTRGRS
jgi:hypothetical protein